LNTLLLQVVVAVEATMVQVALALAVIELQPLTLQRMFYTL
jgi:hypothetical protein